MKYSHLDLGPQEAGSTVVVRVRGGATGVLLLNIANFLRYQADRSFHYHGGGRYRGKPVRIQVPHDDHWFVVLELGTYNGRARATVEVLPLTGAGRDRARTRALVDA
jgi:hypothetical protein